MKGGGRKQGDRRSRRKGERVERETKRMREKRKIVKHFADLQKKKKKKLHTSCHSHRAQKESCCTCLYTVLYVCATHISLEDHTAGMFFMCDCVPIFLSPWPPSFSLPFGLPKPSFHSCSGHGPSVPCYNSTFHKRSRERYCYMLHAHPLPPSNHK